MQTQNQPMFDTLCKRRLGKAIAVCEERGNQYGDTLRNGQWLASRAVARKFNDWGLTILSIASDTSCARALSIAGLVDIKYQRFEGGYKVDNLDDGINYSAVLVELMHELELKYGLDDKDDKYPGDK
jgi:hypothetical protein